MQRVNLNRIANGGLQGPAFNPNSGNLFTFDQNHATLFEISDNGELVSTRDVSSFDELQSPAGMVFCPQRRYDRRSANGQLICRQFFADTIVELSITPVQVIALPTPAR
jgi:hypothetical protein